MHMKPSHLDEVNWIGKLADLKHSHYHNTLALSALIELLVKKGLLSIEELQRTAAQLDGEPPDS